MQQLLRRRLARFDLIALVAAVGLKNVDEECLHGVCSLRLRASERGLPECDTEPDENGEQKYGGAHHAAAMPSDKLSDAIRLEQKARDRLTREIARDVVRESAGRYANAVPARAPVAFMHDVVEIAAQLSAASVSLARGQHAGSSAWR